MASTIPYQSILAEVASDNNIEAYFVGGIVRDLVLGKVSDDIDIVTTDSPPEVLLTKLSDIIGGGTVNVVGQYGTAQFVSSNGIKIEGVRARAESYDPTSRKPHVQPGTLQEDIERRDFTINCLLMPVQEPGKIVDLTGKGLHDLAQKIIRTPTSPNQTFTDDPLRMLRAVRFASVLDFAIADDTMAAIKLMSPRLRIVSPERIATELTKIIMSQHPSRGFQQLVDLQLLPIISPPLANAVNAQPSIWVHSLATLDMAPPELVLRWASLLHALTAPNQLTPIPKLHSHQIMTSLRYSDDLATTVGKLIDIKATLPRNSRHASDAMVRSLIWEAQTLLPTVIALSNACQAVSRMPLQWQELPVRQKQLDPYGQIAAHQLPLSGLEIMEILNLPPGPPIGILKSHLQQAVIEGAIAPDDADSARAWLSTKFATVSTHDNSIGL